VLIFGSAVSSNLPAPVPECIGFLMNSLTVADSSLAVSWLCQTLNLHGLFEVNHVSREAAFSSNHFN